MERSTVGIAALLAVPVAVIGIAAGGSSPNGHIEVELQDGTLLNCRCLCDRSLKDLRSGEEVLVLRGIEGTDDSVVIGRIGLAADVQEGVSAEVPEEVVLEAGRVLTLRVGDGSITIREDGKILIKGKDLVSHATRMNRIKGGSVQIN